MQEVLVAFSPESGDRLLDATVGHGGHAAAYLAATDPGGTVVGLDADEAALAQARERLAEYGERVRLVQGNFSSLKDSLEAHSTGSGQGGGIVEKEDSSGLFNHILFDLGVGSHQLADTTRGFSFQGSGVLTMRYASTPSTGSGRASSTRAAEKLPPAQIEALNVLERRLGELPDVIDLLQYLSADDLAQILRVYGEERYARRIASALKEQGHVPTRADELARSVAAAVPAGYRRGRLHPATRTFQALRLAVNRELEALAAALPQAVELLRANGVLGVISFHSLEDRIVKRFFKSEPRLAVLTRKPVVAGEAEVAHNPRARSAKFRAARRQ